jgi:hypothetical protein
LVAQEYESTLALEALYRLAESDPAAALARLSEFDATLEGDIHYAAFRPGILIDAGSALDDLSVIQEGVNTLAELLEAADPRIEAWHGPLYYNLGNGYSALANRRRRNNYDPDDPLFQETKQAYRKAIAADGSAGGRHLLAEVCVNYGNALSACGRHYEALLAYDQALRAEPTHSMALGNKGIELEHYAYLARNQSVLLLAEAYELCRAAAEDPELDRRGLAKARAIFASHRDALEPRYGDWREQLEKVRARQQSRVNRTQEEDHHLRFAADHGLFLNLCVHDWPCAEKHADGLFFSGYVVPIDDPDTFSRLARYFNQAKEDYSTARYLLAEAQRPTARRQRISDQTHYADVLEYADYGLTAGLAKTALALAYNVLDKIAIFLKWDLGLPEREEETTFRNVWYPGRHPSTLRPEIRAKGDPSLFALYDIALDLRLDPSYKRLRALRHAITHRHLVVHDWLLMVGEHSSANEHILLDELIEQGVTVLRLVKAAMIYLAAYLSQDQRRKESEASGVIAPLVFHWQHEMR